MNAGYDFGYSWSIQYGALVPLVLAVSAAAVAHWRGWRWMSWLSGAVALWALAALLLVHVALGINRPVAIPTERFLASGSGRVLDAGAGSGRAAIGVLLARPHATVVGLDLYDGYYGIDGNTPERFMANARVAGVAGRAEARRGDMRRLPFDNASFDAVVSAYALDHLRGRDSATALGEAARVIRPGGELLLLNVNPDWIAWVSSPHAVAHHPRPDRDAWRTRLQQSGFTIEDEGTAPATWYVLARRR
jgi:SAM-dependent methyltransferase